jgi:outer membrane protein W
MKTIKKCNLSILLMACAIQYSVSQNVKAIVSVNMGVAIPTDKTANGFKINNGACWGLDAAYFISNSVGIALAISQQSHKVPDYVDFFAHTSSFTFNFYDPYKQTGILAGPCFAINFAKIAIDIKPMIGVVFNEVPGVGITYRHYNDLSSQFETDYYHYNKVKFNELAGGGSVAMRMSISPFLSLRFFMNYVQSDMTKFLSTGVGMVYVFKSKSE